MESFARDPRLALRTLRKQPSFVLTAAGLLLGSLGSVVAARALATQLHGVSPGDPLTVAVVTAIMLMVAIGASYLPARRAAAVDPQLALSAE